jgi:hypothetical protein
MKVTTQSSHAGVCCIRQSEQSIVSVMPSILTAGCDRQRRLAGSGSGDDRRKIGPMLRELAAVDHIVCSQVTT